MEATEQGNILSSAHPEAVRWRRDRPPRVRGRRDDAAATIAPLRYILKWSYYEPAKMGSGRERS